MVELCYWSIIWKYTISCFWKWSKSRFYNFFYLVFVIVICNVANQKNMEAITNLNHVAGEPQGLVQRCTVCEGILTDNRGQIWFDGNGGYSYWAEGPVYKVGNMTAIGRDEELPDCTPSS